MLDAVITQGDDAIGPVLAVDHHAGGIADGDLDAEGGSTVAVTQGESLPVCECSGKGLLLRWTQARPKQRRARLRPELHPEQ